MFILWILLFVASVVVMGALMEKFPILIAIVFIPLLYFFYVAT